jgi:methionyl-tRNA synthetase
MLRARNEGISPQEVVDIYHERNKESFARLGISFDYYGRTSSELHHRTSQDFFRELAKKNVFTLKSEKQLYDEKAKIFLADRFVYGTCPRCKNENAYGDQCEVCGTSLSPTELINPRSAITDAAPVLRETIHWYLPLSKFQKRLEQWVAGHPEWKSNVLGQIQSWFNDGLNDRAVTRDLSWGVPVPADIAKKLKIDITGKVLYVWFDAPIGYISATKEWAKVKGQPGLWKEYWQNKDTRLIHFIGKDNIVFHCIIFPAMLMAHGDFVLPDNVPANEFLNLEGNKLSTSRNYAVWLDEFLEKFPPDSLRYCLANNLPETKDADFSWKDFQSKHNNELADILGNFINRTLIFTLKNFNNKVPMKGEFDLRDIQLIDMLKQAPDKIGAYIDNFQFRQALKEMMDIARFANKYFNDNAPWKTIKTDAIKCATTISLCLETIKNLAILFSPVIPFTAIKLKKILCVKDVKVKNIWDIAAEMNLPRGHTLNHAEILFTKIDDKEVEMEIEKLESISGKALEKKEKVSIEDFKKIDIRVAEIINAEKVPKTDKLMKIQITIGEEQRQIIAGIAEHYTPDDLVGEKIVVIVNLKPVIIHGLESNGMLLAAKDGKKLTLIKPEHFVHSGSEIS